MLAPQFHAGLIDSWLLSDRIDLFRKPKLTMEIV